MLRDFPDAYRISTAARAVEVALGTNVHKLSPASSAACRESEGKKVLDNPQGGPYPTPSMQSLSSTDMLIEGSQFRPSLDRKGGLQTMAAKKKAKKAAKKKK